MMFKEVIAIVWLAVLSICDIKRKSVPLWLVWAGMIFAAAVSLHGGIRGEINMLQLCKSLIPGTVLLILAGATGKAGCGDGIIVMALGLAAGYETCLFTLFGGLILIALFSGGLLIIKKANRNTKIPFVPFLTAGWLLTVCGKRGVL